MLMMLPCTLFQSLLGSVHYNLCCMLQIMLLSGLGLIPFLSYKRAINKVLKKKKRLLFSNEKCGAKNVGVQVTLISSH